MGRDGMGDDLMAAELAIRDELLPATTLNIWREATELAKVISNTDFVPRALRNNPAAVTAAILTGAELGLPPMASLKQIFVIDGRPGLYAEAMRALIQSKGHEIWPDDEIYTNTRVRLYAIRKGTDRVVKVEWNLDMAKAANLATKATWRAYPRSMLLARCTGELGRLLFADVLGGVSYTVEELQDGFVGDEEALELESDDKPEPAKAITRKASPPKRTAAAKQTAPAPVTAPPLPPLPGEEESSPPPDGPSSPVEPDEQVKKRAQMIAMKCQEAGLDDDGRHHLISAVTNGQKESAKTVTAEEGADVLLALVEINAGRKALVDGDDGWTLIDVEDASGDPFQAAEDVEQESTAGGVEDAASWSATQWRQYLATKGVTLVELLREAHRLCGESPDDLGAAPGSVGELAGRGSLCGLLVGWVEDHADPTREF